jgi:hypothetical protein
MKKLIEKNKYPKTQKSSSFLVAAGAEALKKV